MPGICASPQSPSSRDPPPPRLIIIIVFFFFTALVLVVVFLFSSVYALNIPDTHKHGDTTGTTMCQKPTPLVPRPNSHQHAAIQIRIQLLTSVSEFFIQRWPSRPSLRRPTRILRWPFTFTRHTTRWGALLTSGRTSLRP